MEYNCSQMPDDERPKRTKSWSEIDKQRDKSGPRKSNDRERDSFEKSTGYTKYKANLDRLFSGGVELPEHLREKADPSGALAGSEEARKKLFAIEDGKLFNTAATEFLKTNPLPNDSRLLDRLLSHPDEDTVDLALTRLEEMHKAGTLKAPPALKQRLSSVEIDSGTPSVRRRAAELRKSLR
jgi:hypothetical protein